MPADVSVIKTPQLREKFETHWSVPGQSAVERMKFLKMGWDLFEVILQAVISNMSVLRWTGVYKHTFSSFIECPWDEMTGTVDRVLFLHDIPSESDVRHCLPGVEFVNWRFISAAFFQRYIYTMVVRIPPTPILR